MKLKTYKDAETKEVVLQFTCENQDDLDIFGGLANSEYFGAVIKKAFPNWECPMNWEVMEALGADLDAETLLRDATHDLAEYYSKGEE